MKKVYLKEWEDYSDLYEKRIGRHDILKLVNKLKRHFGLTSLWNTNFTAKRNGHAHRHSITIPSETSMGLVCHEIAHILAQKKYGNVNHNKKYKHCMGMVVRYARKCGYWESELKIETDIKYGEKVKFWRSLYEQEKKEDQEERCPERSGGRHTWTHQGDTEDTINRKVFRFVCPYCGTEREEDWSKSTVDWEKRRQKFLERQRLVVGIQIPAS